MNVLIACESSGRVRNEFARIGHHAVSVDLDPTETPGLHVQHDIRQFLMFNPDWDLMIAFPPCTDLAVSGARYFEQKRRDGRQKQAIDFFLFLAELGTSHIPRIAIENPVGVMSTYYRQPDQIIQPWEYGEPEAKKTCLWLKGLPKLTPTNILPLPETGRWNNQTPSGQNRLGPSSHRAKDRSRTYPGIARAMAEQWGRVI